MATIDVSVRLLPLLLLASAALVLSHTSALDASVYDGRVTSFTAFLRPSQLHVAFASEVNVQTRAATVPTSASTGQETRLGMTVSWATTHETLTSRVRFGRSRDDLSMVQQADGRGEQYDFCSYTSPYFHHATIPGDRLEPATTYYCACSVVFQ